MEGAAGKGWMDIWDGVLIVVFGEVVWCDSGAGWVDMVVQERVVTERVYDPMLTPRHLFWHYRMNA